MNSIKRSVLTLAVLSALGLAACNSGSSSSQETTSGKKIQGVISGFGSVFVNGVEYETDDSAFSVDGAASSEDNLAVGMVVTLEGTVNPDGTTGVASYIEFNDELEGIVFSNTVASDGKLNVMGQIVIVDDATAFESNVSGMLAPVDIQQGNIVEVSGYSSGDGTIYATRLEVKASTHEAGEEIELKGVVSSATGSTFMIGQLTIDYSAAQLEDLPNGAISDGLYVEVKSTDGFDANDQLIASKVELKGNGEKGIDADEGEVTELEGAVTSVVSDTEFMLNGQTVLIDESTEFEHGSASDIIVGIKLQVDGAFDGAGTLVAKEIQFRQEADIKLDAYVDSVDVQNSTLVVLGRTIQVNNLTAMKDEQDEGELTPVRYFSLSDLAAMDRVGIQAYMDDNGNLVATKLERDDDEQKPVELEGAVTAIEPELIVSGITVDMSLVTEPPALTVGDDVEVAGTYTGGALVAAEIAISD